MLEFYSIIQKNKKRIDEVMEHHLDSLIYSKSVLIEAMKYSTLNSGKRIRPLIVYQVGKLFGYDSCSLDFPAAAIEFAHTYSLIHDDLPMMDNDEFRRGKPSCHIKYGTPIAILAGNSLLSLSFKILSNIKGNINCENKLRMISILSSAIGANNMCFGQSLDIEDNERKKFRNNLSYLIQLIYNCKTTSLIRASIYISMLAINQFDNPILDYLDQYASIVGFAFQLQDDILDINKNNITTILSEKDKINYPKFFGLKQSKKKMQKLYKESKKILHRISILGYDTSFFERLSRYLTTRNE